MNDGREILNHLRMCFGSERLFRHSLVRTFTYTEGVQFFAANAGGGAHWMLDILATEPAIRNLVLGTGPDCGFATVKLMVSGSTATLTVDDGNGKIRFVQHIANTDCPERPHSKGKDEPWTFFIERNQYPDGTPIMTMMWPSER